MKNDAMGISHENHAVMKVQEKPLISVIVAVYNGAKTLQRCIDSIVNQTYQSVELIVIDGASNDGSIEILKSNEHSLAYWESEPDRGIYDAWNKALVYVQGDWICFLGADDYFWDEQVVINMIPSLVASYPMVRIVYGSIAIVDRQQKILGYSGKPWRQVKKKFLQNMTVSHPGLMHHKSVFFDYGKFDDSFKVAGDYDFLLRELLHADAFFIADLVTVGVQTGGISCKPEYGVITMLEVRRAHRKAGYQWDGIFWWGTYIKRKVQMFFWFFFG